MSLDHARMLGRIVPMTAANIDAHIGAATDQAFFVVSNTDSLRVLTSNYVTNIVLPILRVRRVDTAANTRTLAGSVLWWNGTRWMVFDASHIVPLLNHQTDAGDTIYGLGTTPLHLLTKWSRYVHGVTLPATFALWERPVLPQLRSPRSELFFFAEKNEMQTVVAFDHRRPDAPPISVGAPPADCPCPPAATTATTATTATAATAATTATTATAPTDPARKTLPSSFGVIDPADPSADMVVFADSSMRCKWCMAVAVIMHVIDRGTDRRLCLLDKNGPFGGAVLRGLVELPAVHPELRKAMHRYITEVRTIPVIAMKYAVHVNGYNMFEGMIERNLDTIHKLSVLPRFAGLTAQRAREALAAARTFLRSVQNNWDDADTPTGFAYYDLMASWERAPLPQWLRTDGGATAAVAAD
jgi:hypothetical protein